MGQCLSRETTLDKVLGWLAIECMGVHVRRTGDGTLVQAPAQAVPTHTTVDTSVSHGKQVIKPFDKEQDIESDTSVASGVKVTATPTKEPVWEPPFNTLDYCDESERVAQLEALGTDLVNQDARFDQITRLMSAIFQVPLTCITLIDAERVCFLTAAGNTSRPRCEGFCEFVLVPANPTAHIVEDTMADARYAGNETLAKPPHIRFYAGAPLVGSRGFRYGTLCVCDLRPRRFASELYNTLVNFADLVVREIEREAAPSHGGSRGSGSPGASAVGLARPDIAVQDGVALLDVSVEGSWVIKYVNQGWVDVLGGEPGAWLDVALQRRCALAVGEAGRELGTALAAGQPFPITLALDQGNKTLRGMLRPSSHDRIVPSNTTAIPSFVRSLSDGKPGTPPASLLPLWFLVIDARAAGEAAALSQAHGSDWLSGDAVAYPPAALAGRFTLGPLLGSGSFGRVYRCDLEGKHVAVKILPMSAGSGEAEGLAEAAVGRRLDHPFIVRTLEHAVCEAGQGAEPSVWIVQEYCDGGMLYDAIDRGWLHVGHDARGHADLAAVLHTAREVAAALAHLHASGVTHGDLTGANVLLCSRDAVPGSPDPRFFLAKVADFGLACDLPPGETLLGIKTYGTISHMPPELLMEGKLSHAADVYALGVLLYEMREGQRAWKGMRALQVMHQVTVLEAGLQPSPPRPGDVLDASVRDLMLECLAREAAARPNAAQVLARVEALLGTNPLEVAAPATPLYAAHGPKFHLDWTPRLIKPRRSGPPKTPA